MGKRGIAVPGGLSISIEAYRRYLTETGLALRIGRELTGPEREAASRRYLAKHPHLKEFATSPNCALVEVRIDTFHVVTRFQEVVEIHVG
jgi:hypothetical protein